MTTFGDVRSLLHTLQEDEEQQVQAWEQLLVSLIRAHRELPGEFEEQWLPYVMGSLEAWPDEIRLAPRDWINLIINKKDPGPLMQLVRAVDVTRMTNPRLQKMCKQEGFEWVRSLSLGGHIVKSDTIKALAKARSLKNLDGLFCEHGKLGANKIIGLSKAPFMKKIRRLTLRACGLNANAVHKLLAKNTLEHLEHLDLSLNEEEMAQAFEALSAHDFPALKTLCLGSYGRVDYAPVLKAPWAARLDWVDLRGWGGDYQRQQRQEALAQSALSSKAMARSLERLDRARPAHGNQAPSLVDLMRL